MSERRDAAERESMLVLLLVLLSVLGSHRLRRESHGHDRAIQIAEEAHGHVAFPCIPEGQVVGS